MGKTRLENLKNEVRLSKFEHEKDNQYTLYIINYTLLEEEIEKR